MQNDSLHKIQRNTRKFTNKQNNRNHEVRVEDVKSWKGKEKEEHEKVRRQRQDLFDNWESGTEYSFENT